MTKFSYVTKTLLIRHKSQGVKDIEDNSTRRRLSINRRGGILSNHKLNMFWSRVVLVPVAVNRETGQRAYLFV